jgi:light-regulated signal transduction histidine kinase (bacteriophytochrome)
VEGARRLSVRVPLDLARRERPLARGPRARLLRPGGRGGADDGVVIDVDDRKRAEDALARSNAELEQSASVASHDLQEPLRVVASYAQLLERRYRARLDADAREFIGYTVAATPRLQQMVSDLLAYSRVTSQAREPRPVDAASAFSEALANLRAATEESGASITHDPVRTAAPDP